MFTGIIREIGTIAGIRKKGTLTTLSVQAPLVAPLTAESESIAVNGACLTVTRKEKNILFFDAVAPTLAKTNLGRLCVGDRVNIEPALTLGDKIGGHFVLGHVDTTARLVRAINRQHYWQVTLALPAGNFPPIVANGSICVEGISLTIKKIADRQITFDIIPYTYLHTTMQYKKPGSWLNIEFDYLLKHVDAEKRAPTRGKY